MWAIEGWHWIVLGVLLVLSELALPAFFLLWFGIGAVCVGILLSVLPGWSLTAQLLVWTVLSVALTVFWFRYLKPRTLTQAGASDPGMVGEIGLLTRAVAPFERGELRFQKPLGGSEVWACLCDEALPAGERVRVLSVEGNLVKVVRA